MKKTYKIVTLLLTAVMAMSLLSGLSRLRETLRTM